MSIEQLEPTAPADLVLVGDVNRMDDATLRHRREKLRDHP
jgi:hypothetical protein